MRLSAIGRGKFSSRHIMWGCGDPTPRVGGLRAEVGTALGQPADRHLERRVGAQRVAVVGILVAGRDQQRPEADHLGQPVLDPLRRPRVLDAAGQTLGDAEQTLDLREYQHTAVRSQTPTVESDVDWFAGHGRQAGQKRGIIGHGGCRTPSIVGTCLQQENSTRSQRLGQRPPAPREFSGLGHRLIKSHPDLD